ncbi:MAG: 5-(carboxyamino)imidazole ribonucleotide synthase [Pseudomonadales bacterium]
MHIGIIGSGQLGLYLCKAAKRLDMQTTVLTPSADCPAAAAADALIVAGLDDVAAACRLAEAVDVLTFEIESVAPAVLQRLAALPEGSARVAPSAEIMLLLQNKSLQKQWLSRNGFPTADYQVLDGATPDAEALAARFGLPLVQKAAFGGYDGRGVQILSTADELTRLWPAPSLVEVFVGNSEEIAVLTARSLDGDTVSYPPTAMHFNDEGNVLDTIVAPAPLPAEVARSATALAERVVARLGGVGLFAIEMFVKDGELLINEISPRVHNSGHHTLEACPTSQFEQHLRAIAGLPLGPADQPRPAVMRNVLYTAALNDLGPPAVIDSSNGTTEVFVHWYGKSGGNTLRKMGHVTALADDREAAQRSAAAALQALSQGEAPS